MGLNGDPVYSFSHIKSNLFLLTRILSMFKYPDIY